MVRTLLKFLGNSGPADFLKRRHESKKTQKKLRYIAETTEKIRKSTWHMGENVNFAPTKPELLSLDAVETKVLKGWSPEAPMIAKGTNIVAFGSCFAQHIADWLKAREYTMLTGKGQRNDDVHVVSYAEGMVNTFVLRQMGL